MTTGDDQLSGSTKKLQSTFQSQTCTKKKKGHGHCLMVCCWSDPLQLSESQRTHNIWDVCSANWWDALKIATPAAGIGQQNGPHFSPNNGSLHVANQCFKSWMKKKKSWMSWAMKFCLICNIHLTSCQPTTTSSSILTIFYRENVSTSCRRQKMQRVRAWIFMLWELTNSFLISKMCWL